MTNIDDVVNHKLDKAACAEMAWAKGDEMTDELSDDLEERLAQRSVIIEYWDSYVEEQECLSRHGNTSSGLNVPASQMKIILEYIFELENQVATRPIEDTLNAQVANRDVLIEGLIETGCRLAGSRMNMGRWDALIKVWQAMKCGGK